MDGIAVSWAITDGVRRVIHAWFRTPRGHYRSGFGDDPGSTLQTTSGHAWPRGGGAAPLEAFPVAGLPNDVGAEIRDFDSSRGYALPKFRNALRKSRKYMARDIQLAVAAAQLAMSDAGLIDGGVDPTRIGIDLGAGLISTRARRAGPAIATAYAGDGPSFDFPGLGAGIDRR